ncbi:MAG: transposase [Candidatus Cloacimonetes bacterium]|nr:transposase [Candidatus Cloacimonadota bacterium]
MYYDSPVPIPTDKGKITIRRKGSSAYVLYEYERVYDPKKQYNVPKRIIIGKVDETDSSLMFANDSYQIYFPVAVLPELRSEAYRSCALRIGSYIIIDKVAREYNLPQLLKKRFDPYSGLVLDLVAFCIINEDNAAQYYPDFAFSHPLFSEGMHIYSDSTISRLFSSISKDQIIGFLDDWNKGRKRHQRVYISYDSTNKNCQAGDVELVEFGHAKDDKGLPIFNLALAYDQSNRVPLFYEEYPGSINDISQFTFMVDKVLEYGYKNIGFVLDRGYFSKENIRYMDEHGFSFVIMVKGMKTLVHQVVKEVRTTFETRRSCVIRPYRAYGTTVKRKLYSDDEKERYIHIYFSTSRMSAEREQLEVQLEAYKRFIKKAEGKVVEFGPSYRMYFDFFYDKDGTLLYAEEKSEVIEEQLELSGYFCLITSEKMDAEEALMLYKGRDATEKLFSSDKTFIGSKSMRVHSQQSISSKIFIEFLALIIRSRIYTLLKELTLGWDNKAYGMTVPEALGELEKIEMVRRNNGYYRLDHAVTRKQKTILRAFGIDVDYVRKAAMEIGNLLADGSSMMNSSTNTDQEGEENGQDENDQFN